MINKLSVGVKPQNCGEGGGLIQKEIFARFDEGELQAPAIGAVNPQSGKHIQW